MAATAGESTDMAKVSAFEMHAPTGEGADAAESLDVTMLAATRESAGTARFSALGMHAPKDEGADAARSLNEGMEVGTQASVEADRSSTATIKPPTQPITNFPLPRELRDEIYAYLLDAERVEKTAETTEFT